MLFVLQKVEDGHGFRLKASGGGSEDGYLGQSECVGAAVETEVALALFTPRFLCASAVRRVCYVRAPMVTFLSQV